MGIDKIKERFTALKNKAVERARVNIAEYKKRKAEKKEYEKQLQMKERAKFEGAYSRERLHQAAVKGREKAKSGGFFGALSANMARNQKQGNMLTVRNIWETDNKNKGVIFSGGGLSKNIITGQSMGMGAPRRQRHKAKRHNTKKSKSITISYG
jgi:hypothetical protein